ncbi:hypothetical protein L596_030790 [Steinernema carpocapsae]|uniref:Uncharacterized protein n=1 Tax=Steinernema carpocapsae TaxID=34508 RepID=A0A4U5LNU0_STECR|nr:hypothetical protein L596_030790 [Steinernema carpocapsae]
MLFKALVLTSISLTIAAFIPDFWERDSKRFIPDYFERDSKRSISDYWERDFKRLDDGYSGYGFKRSAVPHDIYPPFLYERSISLGDLNKRSPCEDGVILHGC